MLLQYLKKRAKRIFIGSLFIVILAISTFYAFGSQYETRHPVPILQQGIVKLQRDSLVINLTEIKLVQYADTGSMEPFLFQGATGIEVPVKSVDDLHLGDIVSYKAEWMEGIVTHRIVAISNDKNGAYYTLKGDANANADPEKVRFSQIKYKLAGVLY